MRILFYSSYFYPYISGLTIYPLRILKHLSKKYKITVLTFSHQDNLKKKERINDNLVVKRLPYLFKISKGYVSPHSLIYFWQNAIKHDLVFINLPNFEALFLAIIAKLLRKKTIVLFHCQVVLGDSLFEKIVQFFLNLSVRFQLALADKIITYPQYKNLYNYNHKIKTSLPLIDTPEINDNVGKKLLNLKKNHYWIGFAGRIAREKGIEYLIQAVSQIKESPIELIFAGPYGEKVTGEKEYYLKIKKLLEDKRIKYQFLGELAESELGAFYKTLDVLVLPSINSTEAFGMVQAEAMITGTLVIASDLPGVRIPISLTKMGILTQPENSDEISQAINKIFLNRQEYTNKNLVNQAKKIFDKNKIYDFYDRLFKEVA